MNDSNARASAQQFLDALFTDAPAASLRARVDWPRFRLMQLMQATAGADVAAREDLVTRGLDALAKLPEGTAVPDLEERALRSLRSLIEILIGRRWRFVDGYDNPLLAGLRAGPVAAAPPGVRRYLLQLAELARAATPVTITNADDDDGQKLMTLLLVDGRYCGFLPGNLRR